MYVVCESCIVRDNKFLSTAFTPALRYSLLQVHVDLYSSWFICTQKESECVCKSKGWNTCTLTKVCCSNTLHPHTCSKNSGIVHMCDTTQSYEWHDSFTCVTWLIYMCAMTRSYVAHDSFTCNCVCTRHCGPSSLTQPIHMCAVTRSYVGHDSFTCTCVCTRHCATSSIKWLLHMCAMTRSYLGHDSITWTCVCTRRYSPSLLIHMCARCLVHTWDVTHLHVPACTRDAVRHHYSFTCVTWLVHMCAVTRSNVGHDSFTCTCKCTKYCAPSSLTHLIHVCVYMTHEL